MGSPAVGSGGVRNRTAPETVATMDCFFQRGFVGPSVLVCVPTLGGWWQYGKLQVTRRKGYCRRRAERRECVVVLLGLGTAPGEWLADRPGRGGPGLIKACPYRLPVSMVFFTGRWIPLESVAPASDTTLALINPRRQSAEATSS
jgi:hypothetical protein